MPRGRPRSRARGRSASTRRGSSQTTESTRGKARNKRQESPIDLVSSESASAEEGVKVADGTKCVRCRNVNTNCIFTTPGITSCHICYRLGVTCVPEKAAQVGTELQDEKEPDEDLSTLFGLLRSANKTTDALRPYLDELRNVQTDIRDELAQSVKLHEEHITLRRESVRIQQETSIAVREGVDAFKELVKFVLPPKPA